MSRLLPYASTLSSPARWPLGRIAASLLVLFTLALLAVDAAPAQAQSPPAVSRAVVNGSVLSLAYEQVLDDSSVPPASAFTVKVNGTEREIRTPTEVFGPYVRLWLTESVYIGERVTVSYTPPATNPIQSSQGVRAAALSERPVHNRTTISNPTLPLSRAVQLVRNLKQLDTISVVDKDFAQAFTTGSNAGGYRLTRLDLDYSLASGSQPSYTVKVRPDDNGKPATTSLGTLANPSTLGTGLNTYAAPGDGIALAANTTYWVVVDLEAYASSSTITAVQATGLDAEDCSRPGWSIAHRYLSRNITGAAAWTETAGRSVRIEVHGRLVGAEAPLVSNFCQLTGNAVSFASDAATSFTTGGERWGYLLTGLDVGISEVMGTPVYSVSIRSDSSGSPGSSLGTLANPSTLSAGLNTLTAPGTGIKLYPYTTYWVVFDSQATNTSSWSTTSEPGEDIGAAAGWSIGDASLIRSFTSTNSSDWSTTAPARLPEFAVHATVAPPEPGPVPSPVRLVSNTGQASQGVLPLNFDLAQAFTTGSNSQGYTLTRLDVDFVAVAASPAYTVSIHSNSSGSPGSSLGTLTKPSSLSAGLNSFHAPGGGISLAANTTYWLVVDSGAADNRTQIRGTGSSQEDSGALPGWSIADSVSTRIYNINDWTSPSSHQVSFKLAIHGEVTGATADPPARITADAQNVYVHLGKDINTGSTGSHPMSGDRCPASAAFTLKVNGVEYGSFATRDVVGPAPGNFDGNGLDGWRAKCNDRLIHLELWSGPGFYLIPPGSTVTLSYDPNWDGTCPECRQVAYTDGTVMPAFTDKTVDNNAPYLWWTSVNGTDLLAYFALELAPWSAPAPDAFTVMVNGARRNVAAGGVSFFGNYNAGVKLVLESPVYAGDTVTLAYTQPSQNPLRGTRGNPAVPDFDVIDVRNESTGSAPPVPVLVSNTGQTDLTNSSALWRYDYAQGFTTGSNAEGYTLTQVRTGLVSGSRSSGGVSLSIWSDSSGSPGSSLGTLTKPSSLSGGGVLDTFTAPGGGIDLAANTKYHVVFDASQSSTDRWLNTESNTEDSGGAAGWTIADNLRFRDFDSSGSWSVSTAFLMRLAIQGYAKSGGTGGNSGPSPRSSSVSGTQLKMTFDATLSQGLAPPGGSFKVTAEPPPQPKGGAGGNGGAGANGGMGGAFGTGAQATSGVRATSGGGTIDIPGTGTVTVDGADVTVTLARPVPPGSTLTVAYTPPDEDEDALRGLQGAKVQEFSGEPATQVAPPANRAPVVDEESQNYAGFTASGNAPRGVLVTKDFDGIFSDPDGDELTYTVALSDPGQAALVETLHVLTPEELEERERPDALAHLVWFRADTEADWGAMDPAPPDPVAIEVTVTATDSEGLTASVQGVFSTHWAPPTVESVAVVSDAGADDTYALGDTIRVAVTFSEAVNVDTTGGTPQLTIDMDPADWGSKQAVYEGGSGTTTLTFAYEVVEPNYSSQGIAVLADTLALNGGAISLASPYQPTALETTDADLSHTGLAHDPDHKVDWQQATAAPTTTPTVTAVAVTSDAGSDDTYALGDVIQVTVTFSEAVDVTGSPRLSIDMDPADWGTKWAAYAGGSGTTTLTFTHTVVEPNYSSQGIAVLANTLALNGGSIESTAADVDAALSHTGLGHDSEHKVDWQQASATPPPTPTTPTVTAVAVTSDAGSDDTYALGDVIRITVTFSEAVDVTGTPQLTIDMDPADWGSKQAAYTSGSGTTTLTFTYTVVEPNYSSQGIAVLADTLVLNGGSIESTAADVDADLSHTGLAHDADHKVDWQQSGGGAGS